MKSQNFDPNRTLELGDARHYRAVIWFELFDAMRDVAPEPLRKLGEVEVPEWLALCHLDRTEDDWIRIHAQQVRENWQVSDFLWKKLSPGMVTGGGFMVYEPDPIQIAWSPQSESENEFRASAESAIEEHVGKVLAAKPWRQSRNYRAGMRDMRWLVKFQVLGESWTRIAREHAESVTRDTVKAAVGTLAADMGLALRTRTS